MKKSNRSKVTSHRPAVPAEPHYAELADPQSVVEHLSIPAFLRRVPHRFHLEEIRRYGDRVGQMAEALQLSYLTTIDKSLGMIRIFPEPLLQRVYRILSAQFGWPQIVDATPALEDAKAELRANERAKERLLAASETTDNPVIAQAMKTVLTWLDSETDRLAGKPLAPGVVPLHPVD